MAHQSERQALLRLRYAARNRPMPELTAIVKLANEQIDKLVPDGPRHPERPEQRQLDGVGRLHGAAGQPAVDARHSWLRRQLVPESVARTRGDDTGHGVRTADRRHDDQGL